MTEYRARIGEIIKGKEFDQLVAIALGSCIGIVIYDPKIKVATLAHVALPGQLFKTQKINGKYHDKPGRYADTAVPECIRILKKMGANLKNLKAKIAGGSRMFGTKGLLGPGLNIGDRNIEASREHLKLNKIELKREDVSGNSSRTVIFDIENSKYTIKKGFNAEFVYL
ncbi:MAG: chemotaxis protein CheD [Candidatus Heimdallarchaeota archaeon]|nr:chemotaxis protein CheD [Candidatus Heimdallarchaeota archaeon]